MRKNPNRCRIDIIADILVKSQVPVAPTSLIRKCRLMSGEMPEKIGELVKCGLLTEYPNGRGGCLVCVTERGKRFLGLYVEMCGLLRSEKE